MKQVLFILTLLLCIPVIAQEEKPIEVPQIAVKIGIDETIKIDGISIVFKEVVEDSRCPKNVQCAWAGRARVLVGIINQDGEEIEKTIVFKPGMGVISEIMDDLRLDFLKLTPYPDANIAVADRAPYNLLARTTQQ